MTDREQWDDLGRVYAVHNAVKAGRVWKQSVQANAAAAKRIGEVGRQWDIFGKYIKQQTAAEYRARLEAELVK